jgi:hypothetical protein
MASLEDAKSASRFPRLQNFKRLYITSFNQALQPDQLKPLKSDETTQVKEYKETMQPVSSPILPCSSIGLSL